MLAESSAVYWYNVARGPRRCSGFEVAGMDEHLRSNPLEAFQSMIRDVVSAYLDFHASKGEFHVSHPYEGMEPSMRRRWGQLCLRPESMGS